MKRPRLRFSLLALLIVVSIVGVALAVWVRRQALVTLSVDSSGNRIEMTLDRHRLLSITDISLNGESLVWRGDSSWRVIADDWSGAEWVNTWRPGNQFQLHMISSSDDRSLDVEACQASGPARERSTIWAIASGAQTALLMRSYSWTPRDLERLEGMVVLDTTEEGRANPVYPLRLFLTNAVTHVRVQTRVTVCGAHSPDDPECVPGIHTEMLTLPVPGPSDGHHPRRIPFSGSITLVTGEEGPELRISSEVARGEVNAFVEWDTDRGCPVVLWQELPEQSQTILNLDLSAVPRKVGPMATPVCLGTPPIFFSRREWQGQSSYFNEQPLQRSPVWRQLAQPRDMPMTVWSIGDACIRWSSDALRPYPRPHPVDPVIPSDDQRELTLSTVIGGHDMALLSVQSTSISSGEDFTITLPTLPGVDLSLEATRCLDIEWLTDPDGAIGLTPEILIPVENGGTVHATPEGQGLLLTARIARDATPGVVSGEILFNGEPIPIRIEIAEFQLPERPTLRSAFELYGWNLNDHSEENLRRWAEVFADNRLSIAYPRAPSGRVAWDGDVIADWSGFETDLSLMIDQLGMTTFFIPSGMRGHHADEAMPRGLEFAGGGFGAWPMYLREMRSRLEERGWLDEAVLFLWDEPNATEDLVNTYRTCADLITQARAEMPDTPIYISTTDVIPELEAQWPPDVQGAVNMSALRWAPMEDIAARPRWLTLDGMVRTWITSDLSGPRAAPLIAWAFGLEGIELWSVNAWHDERAWNPGLLATIDTSSFEPIGPVMAAEVGGILLYQDEQGRPLRSLTWVALGQGMEDVELLEALRSVEPKMAESIAESVRNQVRQTGTASPLSEDERSQILSAL